jgi:hypothetical protein
LTRPARSRRTGNYRSDADRSRWCLRSDRLSISAVDPAPEFLDDVGG